MSCPPGPGIGPWSAGRLEGMYVPEWFRIQDQKTVLRVVRAHPFATLVSTLDGEPFATHLPIVIEQEDPLVLVGHIAAQNPQAACFDGSQVLMAVFHGPHAYISPSDYETKPNVPTWNYVAVHAYGRAERVSGGEALAALGNLVATFDPDLAATAPEAADPASWESKLKGIAMFRMRVERVDAKAKLNQNKAERDRESVVSALRGRGDAESTAVAIEMGK